MQPLPVRHGARFPLGLVCRGVCERAKWNPQRVSFIVLMECGGHSFKQPEHAWVDGHMQGFVVTLPKAYTCAIV